MQDFKALSFTRQPSAIIVETDEPIQDSSLRISHICRDNGLRLEDRQVDLLRRYVDLLRGWNARVNLISRRDEENIWWSHILHSLSFLFFLQPGQGMRLLDLGTGGGLPGIPLAILRNDLHIVLLDSIRKKTAAVQEMAEQLPLTNVRVETGRAEEVSSKSGFSGAFDIVVARAVAPLEDLVRWSRPLLRGTKGKEVPHRLAHPAGRSLSTPLLVALKGGDLSEEVRRAQQKARSAVISANTLVFPGSEELGLEDKRLVTVEF
ncbi:16S rRNA (guanine(527)-N(7))-methyltransferase RsmG [bacterium]|nr:MAG: 16S rRNA (guanine(527)-N(7))-methyltransferase RsmG [bacterium]